MKKVLKIIMILFTALGCIACSSSKELSQQQIDLIMATEPTGSILLISNMEKDGYEKKYDKENKSLSLTLDNVGFQMNEKELKFFDKDGEYIYKTEIEDKGNKTLLNLANLLEKYEVSMADVYFVFDIEYKTYRNQEPKEYDNEVAQKLIKAGYKISNEYQWTEDNSDYRRSTWEKELDDHSGTCFIDFVNKKFIYKFSKDVRYQYDWKEEKAKIIASTQTLVYNTKTSKVEATYGLDEKTEVQYKTQALYIYQEYQKEMKRIGITKTESMNYIGEKN
ncbi:MAG: hypothetical protein ACLUVC_01775 [Longibaculum sp.]